jgi:hypothetical protein
VGGGAGAAKGVSSRIASFFRKSVLIVGRRYREREGGVVKTILGESQVSKNVYHSLMMIAEFMRFRSSSQRAIRLADGS